MFNKKQYKLSKYNVIFEREGSSFIWNTVTGAVVKADDEAMHYLNQFDATHDGGDYFNKLKANGCIVKADLDETAQLLKDEKAAMSNPSPEHLHYTIAPGLGCNFNCTYCFEKNRTSVKSMNLAMQDRVCDYIIQVAEDDAELKHLAITWFGGEPLLYTAAIEHMSKRLMTYCRENNILYTAGIVTNGRYLTVQAANMLKTCHVEYVQLAVDGMREYYARQKQTDPRDFDFVVKNIMDCAGIIPITVRINVEQDMTEALKLTDYLLKQCRLDGKIKIYIAHVRDYEGRTLEKEAAAHKAFLKKEWDYMNLFLPAGKYHPSTLFFTPPKRRCTTCPSVCQTNYCIGPQGELYRCEHFFGRPEQVVGFINKPSNSNVNNSYLNHKHPKKCIDCKIFPICLGGCMNDVRDNTVSISCDDFIRRQIDYLLLSLNQPIGNQS